MYKALLLLVVDRIFLPLAVMVPVRWIGLLAVPYVTPEPSWNTILLGRVTDVPPAASGMAAACESRGLESASRVDSHRLAAAIDYKLTRAEGGLARGEVDGGARIERGRAGVSVRIGEGGQPLALDGQVATAANDRLHVEIAGHIVEGDRADERRIEVIGVVAGFRNQGTREAYGVTGQGVAGALDVDRIEHQPGEIVVRVQRVAGKDQRIAVDGRRVLVPVARVAPVRAIAPTGPRESVFRFRGALTDDRAAGIVAAAASGLSRLALRPVRLGSSKG